MGNVLNDHVDVDVAFGKRCKNARNRAWTIRHIGECDLGFILVMGDARYHLAFHVIFSNFIVTDDQRPGLVIK